MEKLTLPITNYELLITYMLILGIETSCDETSASLVEDGTTILSNVVASSQEMHIKTGGIIPEMAAREQVKCIVPVIQAAIEQCDNVTIDSIAVTVGPGLIGSLLVGVETAKTLAYLWNKPIIPVNHLLAHVYANWLTPEHSENSENQKIRKSDAQSIPSFPNIALIVSGGHTELLLMKNHGDYEVLGGTRDDAAGECFDKVARLLGLGYPGGPAISAAAKLAARRSPLAAHLPRPMIDSNDFDFSFSGLKTAVLREVIRLKTIEQLNNLTIASLAYEVQEAITDVLVEKTIRAAQEYKVRNILLCGGVAANQRLREKFQSLITNDKLAITFYSPPLSLCTDNAASIASCAFFNHKPIPWTEIQANPSMGL